MFLKLSNKSYIKYKPNSYIFSIFKDRFRNPVEINESAAEILALCDGTNTKEDIISILSEEYNDSPDIIKENVNVFLEPFLKSELVQIANESLKSNIIRGSQSIYYPDMLIWEVTNYCPLKYKDDKFSIKVTPDEAPTKNCGAGYQLIAIKPNMDIAPCATVDFKMGNLKSQTFEQIMQNFGEKFSQLESPCKKHCDGCEEEKNCSGCLSQGLTLKNKVKDCKWARTQKLFFEAVKNV